MSRLFVVLLSMLAAAAGPVRSEQFIDMGGYQAHYMILDTLSLEPRVAARYGLARSRNSSILTLSILDAEGTPVAAEITGEAINLLGQTRALAFETVSEGGAHYALAAFEHAEEQMRFALAVQTPDGRMHELKFEQKLYPGIE